MTTDITELAQSLKAAAEKATPGPWQRSSVRFNGITDIANPMGQGNKPHVANASEKRDAEFIALANPANILALVEALERSESRLHEVAVACATAEQAPEAEKRICATCRKTAKSTGEKLEKAQGMEAYWKTQCRGITDHCEELQARIAELEPFHTAYIEWSDKTDWVQTDKRFGVVKPLGKHRADVLKEYIQHLESRTMKLPAERFCPAEYAGSQLWSETEVWNKAITACADALRAAGIKVEAE